MRKSIEIKLNPEVLKALRDTSGYTIDEVAKKINTTTEKIEKTEKGTDSFTLIQIKKLANIYQRPLAAFFTDTLPKMPVLSDYRINREKRLTPQVYIAERRAYYLANKLAELTYKKSQIPTFPETLKPDDLASEFRNYLKIEVLKSIKSKELLANYKQVLEEKLLISIIELPLKATDVRGFVILSDISVIVLNEEDKPPIKLFSLFHEVYHLIKRTSGICSIEIEQESDRIEKDCDLFSAEFLVPMDDLKKECKRYSQLDENAISEISKIYGVSKQVIMLRLLWSGYITNEKYNQFKREGVKKLQEKKEEMFGYKNWDKVFQNRIGNLAIKEINNSYRIGKISYSEVFDILNMKTKYIEKFVER
ncbi:MAG: XRE family transcriptional regulator [Candidatus Cloacimonadota bacterium]|nr:XRE family transcriptional regulator [Candidatus Cloacimonadota bacterium]